MLEDIVIEESVACVKSAVHELVEEHLARAAAYDIMGEIFEEILKEEMPELVSATMYTWIVIILQIG